MNSPIFKWLCQLEQDGIIEEFDLGAYTHHRLCAPLKIDMSEEFVDKLRAEYTRGAEKGGLFLFEILKHNNEVTLVLKDIRFLSNKSTNPEWSYLANRIELLQSCEYAMKNRLFPCIFHSHPTMGPSLIWECYNYITQMGTSEEDMAASLEHLPCGLFDLRLPEFLVVCNGQLNTGIFIGVYGGLIAPLSFDKEKRQITERFIERNGESVINYFNTTERKLWGAAGAVGLLFLWAKYPKAATNVLVAAGVTLPPVMLETEGKGNFFRVSTQDKITINIPSVPNEEIVAEERNQRQRLHDLREAKKRDSGQL